MGQGTHDVAVPRTPDDLTPAWLSAALGAEVTAVTATDIGAGSGLFGVVLRLELTHDGNAPDSLIAKLPTTAEANLIVGNALGIYEREVRFYAELAGSVPIRVPECYFGRIDDTGSILLLEDIRDLQVGDQVAGITEREAERIVDALAALHATFWEHQDLESMTWLPKLDAPVYAATVPGIFHTSWPTLRENFAHILNADDVALGNRLDPRFEEVVERCCVGPITVIHTDSRLDNLFFHPSGGDEIAFIDWQLAIRGRGISDVAYLIGTSLDAAEQPAAVPRLVRRYHDALQAHGVTDYSFDDCLRHYREHSLYYLVGACTMASFDVGNERGKALADTYVERMFSNARVCDAASEL